MRVHVSTRVALRRAVTAIAAMTVAFAMLGSIALAAPPVERDHIASSGAGAANNACVGTICSATSVFAVVNTPDGPSQACLDISRYEQVGTNFIQLGFETGCAPLAPSSLTIDTKGLTTAALSPTQIAVQVFTCDSTGCNPTATRTALVSATYTGVGTVATFRSNSKSIFGGCAMYFVGKGSSREAAATLTIDGRTLDALGSIFASTQKTKILCH